MVHGHVQTGASLDNHQNETIARDGHQVHQEKGDENPVFKDFQTRKATKVEHGAEVSNVGQDHELRRYCVVFLKDRAENKWISLIIH